MWEFELCLDACEPSVWCVLPPPPQPAFPWLRLNLTLVRFIASWHSTWPSLSFAEAVVRFAALWTARNSTPHSKGSCLFFCPSTTIEINRNEILDFILSNNIFISDFIFSFICAKSSFCVWVTVYTLCLTALVVGYTRLWVLSNVV